MQPPAKSSTATLRHYDGIAPLANIFAVGGNGRWFADENHILAHLHRQLARVLGVRRDDRPVVAGAAPVHGEIGARAGRGSALRSSARRRSFGEVGQLTDRDAGLEI